jgi:hypothetical protein
LFEDLVVGHWLAFNVDDPEWLIQRFLEHRDAMALYQQRLVRETTWRIAPVAGVDLAAAARRQNVLFKQFGGEAQANCWDPGARGRGQGKPIGLRGVALYSRMLLLSTGCFIPGSPAARSRRFGVWNL